MNTYQTKDGLKLAYYVDDFTKPWTTPDTVFLLHAAMGNSQRWFSWLPALASQYRVIRMDLRGHGASDIPSIDQPFSLQLLVDDAKGLLDQLGINKVHLVGNSAGGYVAQQFALQSPERLHSLALYGATPGLKNSHALTWIPKVKEVGLKKFLADTIQERFDEHADPDLVSWFIEQAGSNDPAFIARFVTHMCTHDFMEDLVGITCPTLIVAAGKESIGHANAYEEMHKRIKGSIVQYVDTAGHNICDGYADQCVAMLMNFLALN